MLSSIVNSYSSSSPNSKKNFTNIYQKFQNLIGRRDSGNTSIIKSPMLSSRSTTVSEDSFITPVSSVGDLMALSPQDSKDVFEADVTSDFLTGTDFDSICDVTMQEIPARDDLIIDSSSLDYLFKCAESKRNSTFIDRGKESLFVKFDPLYADKVHSSSESSNNGSEKTECDAGYETGSAMSVCVENQVSKTIHSLSMGSISSCSKEKPTQVVPPTVNEVPKSEGIKNRPTPQLIRSVSAILTPTQANTERLISISGDTPPPHQSPRVNHYRMQEVDRLQSLRVILQKQDQDMLQLRQENRELRSALQDLEHKHSRETRELEDKIKKLTDEKKNCIERETKLLQQVNEKTINNKQMCIVMEEYEKTISSLIGDQQQDKIQIIKVQEQLTAERDEALAHLATMETCFNDLLSKYEKCKSIVFEAKERENTFQQKMAEYEASIERIQESYNELKQVTAEKLAKANETLESAHKSHNLEITKMTANLKRHEITISSIQDSLNQKQREVEELTNLCDQLMK